MRADQGWKCMGGKCMNGCCKKGMFCGSTGPVDNCFLNACMRLGCCRCCGTCTDCPEYPKVECKRSCWDGAINDPGTMSGQSNIRTSGGYIGLSDTHLIIDLSRIDKENWLNKCKKGTQEKLAEELPAILLCGLKQTRYIRDAENAESIYSKQWMIPLNKLQYPKTVDGEIRDAEFMKCCNTDSHTKSGRKRDNCDVVCEGVIGAPVWNGCTGCLKCMVKAKPRRSHKLIFKLQNPKNGNALKDMEITLTLTEKYSLCRKQGPNNFFTKLKAVSRKMTRKEVTCDTCCAQVCGDTLSFCGPLLDVLEFAAEIAVICPV